MFDKYIEPVFDSMLKHKLPSVDILPIFSTGSTEKLRMY